MLPLKSIARTIPQCLLACLPLLAAGSLAAAEYHLAPAGNDANDGLSSQTAFRSLAAACRATPAGKHVIRVAAGKFEETESCVLPSGVSLIGAGIGKTVFNWKAVRSLEQTPMKIDFSGFMIQMKNSSDATISGLTIIGSLPDDQRAYGGILAHEVRNVSIHDCEAKGLEFTGIWLSQAVNSSVHHCRFTDCAHPSKLSCSGALQAGDLTDCTLNDNIIRENRGAYGIKTWKTVWDLDDRPAVRRNKVKLTRVRFHNNDIKVRQRGGWGMGQPNMAMELWNSDPVDCEIDSNRFNECVSLVEGGKAPKTIRVHHNLFILEPGYSYAIEASHDNLEIDHNVFRNGYYPISNFGPSVNNLQVHHNTFDGIEDIVVCNQVGGITDFSFTHNTVVVKKAISFLSIGKEDKPRLAGNVTITNNLFVKEGAPASNARFVNLRGDSKSENVAIHNNAFWNWAPEGDSPLVADPMLERADDGDRLLRISAKSPVREAGIGAN